MHFQPREITILEKLREGKTYAQLADEIGMTYGHVKQRMSYMFKREGYAGIAHAMAMYMSWEFKK